MRNARESLGDPGPVELDVGTLIGDKYRVIARLGEGGMGTVFEAENVLTMKRAALKRLHPRLMESAAGQQRLLREARATSRVRHRNVVDLYDVIVEGDEVILVMELLVGELLSSFMARTQLTFAQLVRLLLPAMEGVAAAHAVGVVHRDVKPENIFLAQVPGLHEPVPKMIDFGISKIVAAEQTQLTRSGVALGTPRYVSYEQLRGERELDGRTDVYSFGVILYEALLGRPPYPGGSLGQQAVQFLTTAPCLPTALRPAVPAALSALVMRAIARDREERLPSLSSLIDQLSTFARDDAYAQPLPLCLADTLPLPSGAVGASLSTRPEGGQVARAHTTDPVAPVQTHRQRRPLVWSSSICLAAACGGLVLLAASRRADGRAAPVREVHGSGAHSEALARVERQATVEPILTVPSTEAHAVHAPAERVLPTSESSPDAGAVPVPSPESRPQPRRTAGRVERAAKLEPSPPAAEPSSAQGGTSQAVDNLAPAHVGEQSPDGDRLRAGHVSRDEF